MSSDYQYDQEGQFFPYFIFTIVALITVPLSYTLLKPTDEIENTAPRIKSSYKSPEDDLVQKQKRKQWRRERRLKRIIAVGLGYAVMALMLYLIAVTQTSAPKIWDPYYILGISRSATEGQIKKKYRDLSKTLHPDKAVPDPSKNQTLETINEHWVEVSKAFKALTDEEIRNNYIQYGHPDGKQGFSIGIALPTIIVNEGSGKYVLAVYGLLLGVLLPYTVGKWWYGTQRMTKEKVLVATASNLFREYKDDITDGDIINGLSSGVEFDEVFVGRKADTGLSSLESSIAPKRERSTASISLTDYETMKQYDGVRRKAAALLWAYLHRIKLPSSSLNEEKYEAAPIAQKLLDSFIAVTLAFGNTGPLLGALRASQHLIQAVPPSGSSLLQLPHFSESLISDLEQRLAQPDLSIQTLMSQSESKRRRLLTDPAQKPCLSMAQYDTAMSVARQLPFVTVETAFFKVVGERYITPGSLVQFVVKARVIPPGSTEIPDVNPKDLEDIDPEEDDLEALLGRKAAGKSETAKSSKPDSKSDEGDEALLPPLAHAPFFPRDHSPRWHIFLTDSRMGKIGVPPSVMTTFDKPLFHEKSGLPTFNVQTFKTQLQAPPQAAKYAFAMHIVCDSYIGSDSSREVVLHVEDAGKAEEIDNEEDEISEPEEDSLAGQMSALKSGNLNGTADASKKKVKGKKPVMEESDDESGTDEDEDDDTSDTDTDTDEE